MARLTAVPSIVVVKWLKVFFCYLCIWKMSHNRILSIVMFFLIPVISQGRDLALRTVGIDTGGGKMKMKVLQPKEADAPVPGILWIHGGGYSTGGQ